jgi:hypothetical protein
MPIAATHAGFYGCSGTVFQHFFLASPILWPSPLMWFIVQTGKVSARILFIIMAKWLWVFLGRTSDIRVLQPRLEGDFL